MAKTTRRVAIKAMTASAALISLQNSDVHAQEAAATDKSSSVSRLENRHDRVWLGEEYWANPMEDWRIVDGAAECQTTGGDRNVQLLTHQLTNAQGALMMSVKLRQVEINKADGGAGFRIGVRSDINEHRSNCFAKNGIDAGVAAGELILGSARKPLGKKLADQEILLSLSGKPGEKGYQLTLTAATPDSDQPLATLTETVPANSVLGNVALVNNFNKMSANKRGARYRFWNWDVSGDALTETVENKFGPILWSMYSLSDSRSDEGFVLKLSALTGPLGEQDNQTVELLVQKNDQWTSLGTADLDKDAWVATFRIPNWDEKVATPFKLVYRESLRDGGVSESDWTGTVKANPVGRPLRVGALTCQNDYAFPYEPVCNNLLALDPDILYFSGDQLYENHGGYGLIRDPADPAILNYLRKYYQHGWSFREAMRDRPTLCLPDDHDVFQGNIWGEGGAPMIKGDTSSAGGYREPARMVNVVHKTNTAHHPDPFDPIPCLQDISVYYGDVVYGDVSFAVVADRQWKSGPDHVDTGGGRPDHVPDPDFDTSVLDKEGLILLGERQEEFLKQWVDDWRGHGLKVLLSQTVFAGVATHHGGYDGYLKADLDCGSWPQTARNRTIDIIRKGMPLHINGDQHLTTLVQYGVEKQRDSCWSFCTPAIAVGYPRWWRPDELGMPHQNRPKHGLADTGEYIDGFGNKAYVYAVGNPEVATKRNRYERAHQKGSGFGIVTIDTAAKTYKLESFKFLVDATDGKASNQFPGWPITIQQQENGGQNVIA
ncbi:alkaline phosphatase D family protein [Blastopirellula sp. J2-11]|uniref:alkaline phosphatase D family protein n=1 Tax=Blastopirellula sp. J2-11 TaxID=2943192 RepID=UPI0021C9A87F|nr:alkaline phosphatase D family protein [Blastopirellula sp. J2-11]UUO06608.1 alkaline phosphatase D family protein [Blastopirellula sp. J2-11]